MLATVSWSLPCPFLMSRHPIDDDRGCQAPDSCELWRRELVQTEEA